MGTSLTTIALVIGVGILGGDAVAQPGASGGPPGMTDATVDPTSTPKHERVDGRNTDRVQVAVGAAMYASYPMSIEDPAPFALIGKPLWLGKRHRFFQWALDADVVAGLGTYSSSLHLAVAPKFGMNLYLGPVFGFELRMGPAGIVQLGENSVAGLGMISGGGYVFRFWDDDRKRIKLLIHMQTGVFFADDPGNDLGTNAMAMGMGVAYETPL